MSPSSHLDSPYLVAAPPPRPDRRGAAIILLATDGTERSDGALRVAAARAEATHAVLEVMVVLETEAHLPTGDAAAGDGSSLLRRTARRRDVETQLTRVLGRDQLHSISVFDGNPAYTISRVAVERRASLLVVGVGRHLVTDRLFSDETALQLARITRVPVLAVPAGVAFAPRNAVVAIDFSETSARAAQAAVECVSDSGHVHLVHVMPRLSDDAETIESERPYERWIEEQLAEVAEALVVPSGVTVTRVALRGGTVPELIGYATRVGADLIATGTHGRGFVSRAIAGSVTTKLLRSTTCAILAVPRDPLPALAPSADDTLLGQSSASPLAWSRMLTDFTIRNLGRRTVLEVDDVEIGAQSQEYDYPLLGASYSPLDRRIELLLGDRLAGGRQLSRTVGGVVAVEVIAGAGGEDLALRVQHGRSQTLLTFSQEGPASPDLRVRPPDSEARSSGGSA